MYVNNIQSCIDFRKIERVNWADRRHKLTLVTQKDTNNLE